MTRPGLKVVFLDIDGVLNSGMWMAQRQGDPELRGLTGERYHFDPDAVAHLNSITDRTGAKIVLSSSWRHHRSWTDLSGLLGSVGVTGELISKTPDQVPGAHERGHEIDWWLQAHPPLESFVILDDGSDMAHLIDRLVHCNFEYGLRAQERDAAIAMLESRYRGL